MTGSRRAERCRNAPNNAADVVCHEQGSGLVDGNAYGAASRIPIAVNEAAQHVNWRAGWLAVAERDEDDFVTGTLGAVPGAMLADKRARFEWGGQLRPFVERQPQGGGVRAETVVGRDGPGDKIGLLLLDPVVHMLTPIAIRPTVERAVAD